MASLAHFLFRERHGRIPFWVRLGIWGGIPLAIFYTIILDIIVTDESADVATFLAVAAVQFGVPLFFAILIWVHRRSDQPKYRRVWRALLAMMLTTPFFGLLFVEPEDWLGAVVMFPIVACLFAGPAWSLCSYGYVSVLIYRRQQDQQRLRKSQTIGGAVYFATIAGACPTSIFLSLSRYSTLPLTPPQSCYVVTAASRGHSWLVGTNQLITLNMFELALQARYPRLHQQLRLWYDWIGPPLARSITSPWVADIAYLSLKPFEWFAILVMKTMAWRAARS